MRRKAVAEGGPARALEATAIETADPTVCDGEASRRVGQAIDLNAGDTTLPCGEPTSACMGDATRLAAAGVAERAMRTADGDGATCTTPLPLPGEAIRRAALGVVVANLPKRGVDAEKACCTA